MKKSFFLYLAILVIEGISFFMGMGFVLLMYRVFTPLIDQMWLFGLGWTLLLSLFSFFPLKTFLEKIKE